MEFRFITVEEAKTGWNDDNSKVRYYGAIDGYHVGYNLEVADKDGNLDYMSCRFCYGGEDEVNAELAWERENYGCILLEEVVNSKGYYLTGRMVFRGYYTSHWDWEERDEYFKDASREVEEFMERYLVH